LLYKVWTKDGHEELVRGAVFGEFDVRALRSSMVAAGDDFYVENRPANIPYSIVATFYPVRRTGNEARESEQRKVAGLSSSGSEIESASLTMRPRMLPPLRLPPGARDRA
jgi:hypothetical protein